MIKAIVGVNWGDEGKGKITDTLAAESDIVVRFQGGSNAGHTIKNQYGKFPLHMLPSGVFYQHTTCVIGNGVALNIPKLIEEVKSIVDRGVPMPHLMVSALSPSSSPRLAGATPPSAAAAYTSSEISIGA